MLYDEFLPVVELVLNNWTALQLAVQHGLGAPGGKQVPLMFSTYYLKTAQLMAVFVARYCVENGVVEREDLMEVLEDLMDEEFETVCHDGSPKEVAALLVHCVGLLRAGRHEELKAQLDAMPKCELWLCQPLQKPKTTVHGNPNDDTSSSGTDDDEDDDDNEMNQNQNFANGTTTHSSESANQSADEPMEEDPDPGWTVVKTRRKK